MEDAKFHILCSMDEGACEHVMSLVKEPLKIEPDEKEYQYVISGTFDGQADAQVWGADLYYRAGDSILRMVVETQKAS